MNGINIKLDLPANTATVTADEVPGASWTLPLSDLIVHAVFTIVCDVNPPVPLTRRVPVLSLIAKGGA